MRYYQYADPIFDNDGTLLGSEIITESEEDIMRTYYPYWKRKVKEVRGSGFFNNLSKQHIKQMCVDDWCVTHWAEEIREEEI